MKIHFRIIITPIFFSINTFSKQLYIKFEKISLEHMLSQNSIMPFYQDSKGFMWFDSGNGLNRHDGYNIEVFMHDPRDKTSKRSI